MSSAMIGASSDIPLAPEPNIGEELTNAQKRILFAAVNGESCDLANAAAVDILDTSGWDPERKVSSSWVSIQPIHAW